MSNTKRDISNRELLSILITSLKDLSIECRGIADRTYADKNKEEAYYLVSNVSLEFSNNLERILRYCDDV
jgi:hypothetical protein